MNDKLEKLYDLVEKIYIELQETKKEVKSNSNHIIKLENETSDKFGILFDFQKSAENHFENIEIKLDNLSDKVDKHDIKIQVIEGGKKKKAK